MKDTAAVTTAFLRMASTIAMALAETARGPTFMVQNC